MLARHSLIWLSDAGWQAAYNDAPGDIRPAIEQWRRAGYPAIVRRMDADAGDDVVCAGIALPPDAQGQKKRIALRLSPLHIDKSAAPIQLEEAIAALPVPWQSALAALAVQAGEQRIVFRVYGSAALQALTGLPYVTAASDIDLLFSPATRTELEMGVHLLAAYGASLPLDGEILFPGGRGVAWKEWALACDAPSHPRVLVKEKRHVRLLKTGDLLSSLREERCTIY